MVVVLDDVRLVRCRRSFKTREALVVSFDIKATELNAARPRSDFGREPCDQDWRSGFAILAGSVLTRTRETVNVVDGPR